HRTRVGTVPASKDHTTETGMDEVMRWPKSRQNTNVVSSAAGLQPLAAPGGEPRGDPTEVRSPQILSSIKAFSNGDFRARLPLDWPGLDGRIAEAFNDAIAQAQHITGEAARLSVTVGKEGRLAQRMSAPGARGG